MNKYIPKTPYRLSGGDLLTYHCPWRLLKQDQAIWNTNSQAWSDRCLATGCSSPDIVSTISLAVIELKAVKRG
ncbi:MAG: hypothetical protein JO334_12890 [Verrucomicrobia bacterium]|nr:hypothetical protein [Verrucomicrobiota bacterium]